MMVAVWVRGGECLRRIRITPQSMANATLAHIAISMIIALVRLMVCSFSQAMQIAVQILLKSSCKLMTFN